MRTAVGASAALALIMCLAPSVADAAPLDSCDPNGAQPLPLNQLVAVPDIPNAAKPAPGTCANARFATVGLRVGDRVTLRATGANAGLRAGFVSPIDLTGRQMAPYTTTWADCTLDIPPNQADEITCTVAARSNALLQLSSLPFSVESGAQVGVWVSHQGQRNRAVQGQCDFLARAPLMALRSTQYANLGQGCENADPQFPVYQRWRLRIGHPRAMTFTATRTTLAARLGDLSNMQADFFVAMPHTDPSDYRETDRNACVPRIVRYKANRVSERCVFTRAGTYTIYALVSPGTIAFKLR